MPSGQPLDSRPSNYSSDRRPRREPKA